MHFQLYTVHFLVLSSLCQPFICPLLPSLSNFLCPLSNVFVLCLPSYVPCTDKKENQIFPIYSIRKFRMEHAVAKSYMTNGLLIYGEISAHFLIYDFATAPLWISLYMRKIWFSFLIVCLTSLFLVSRPLSPVSRLTYHFLAYFMLSPVLRICS